MSTRYVVDGTDQDRFTLSGDGNNAPFAVFDIESQDWVLPFHSNRHDATKHASLLNNQIGG